jgi:hypothetical protein
MIPSQSVLIVSAKHNLTTQIHVRVLRSQANGLVVGFLGGIHFSIVSIQYRYILAIGSILTAVMYR